MSSKRQRHPHRHAGAVGWEMRQHPSRGRLERKVGSSASLSSPLGFAGVPFGLPPYQWGFLYLQVPSCTAVRCLAESRTLSVLIPTKLDFGHHWFETHSLLQLTVLPLHFPSTRALTPQGNGSKVPSQKASVVPPKEQKCRKDTTPVIVEMRSPGVRLSASGHPAGNTARGNVASEGRQEAPGSYTAVGSCWPERW